MTALQSEPRGAPSCPHFKLRLPFKHIGVPHTVTELSTKWRWQTSDVFTALTTRKKLAVPLLIYAPVFRSLHAVYGWMDADECRRERVDAMRSCVTS